MIFATRAFVDTAITRLIDPGDWIAHRKDRHTVVEFTRGPMMRRAVTLLLGPFDQVDAPHLVFPEA